MYGKRKYCYPFINKIFRTSFRLFFLFSILFKIFIHIKGLYHIIHVLTCMEIYIYISNIFQSFPYFLFVEIFIHIKGLYRIIHVR